MAFSGSVTAGKRLVIHFNQLRGVARDVAIGRNHHGHRMSDEVDAIDRQDMVMRNAQAGQRSAARHRADLLRILAGEHRGHAGQIDRRL